MHGPEDYYTEKQTYFRCRYYIGKYNADVLRGSLNDWFDGQLDIGNYLGIDYQLLYRKDTDLEALFARAADYE